MVLVSVAAIVLIAGILATLAVAVRRGDVSATINAMVSLGAAVLPTVAALWLPLGPGWQGPTGATLTAWIAAAGLLHSIGMLGPYESVWWWDHVTHLLSGALVAALVYAGLIALGRSPDALDLSGPAIAGLTVALTMLAGVFWELIELVARDLGERLDVEPVLVHYGWRDTAYDLVFDFLGALLVVALDLRAFVPIAAESIAATRTALLASGGVLLVGSAALAALVGLGGSR